MDTSLTQQPGAEVESQLPTSLADLASSFEAIKSKGKSVKKRNYAIMYLLLIILASGNDDSQYTNRMLDASLQFVPDLIDSERY